MKGREAKGAPAADLLVCFPSRAHLSLMPKPICSPARSSEPNKRRHHHHHSHHHNHHLHHLKKSSTRGSTGQASPLLWAKTKPMGSELASEPTSPKVTCAGQIKVRNKTSTCKSWQSVMEEIERMHNNRKQRNKKPHWAEALGFKKEVMQFLTCLRGIRFDFRCFGSFHHGNDVVTTDDEDDDDELEDDEQVRSKETTAAEGAEGSRTVFSKWFMVLQEEQSHDHDKKTEQRVVINPSTDHEEGISGGGGGGGGGGGPAIPPPNALLLMRCRSAPAKSWLEEREEEEQEEEEEEEEKEEEEEREAEERRSKRSLKCLMEDEKRKMEESVMVMRYEYKNDLYKISSDIAKETWVVGGIRDPLSRSRSWKR